MNSFESQRPSIRNIKKESLREDDDSARSLVGDEIAEKFNSQKEEHGEIVPGPEDTSPDTEENSVTKIEVTTDVEEASPNKTKADMHTDANKEESLPTKKSDDEVVEHESEKKPVKASFMQSVLGDDALTEIERIEEEQMKNVIPEEKPKKIQTKKGFMGGMLDNDVFSEIERVENEHNQINNQQPKKEDEPKSWMKNMFDRKEKSEKQKQHTRNILEKRKEELSEKETSSSSKIDKKESSEPQEGAEEKDVWKSIRAEYREHKSKVNTARKEFEKLADEYRTAKQDSGLLAKFVDNSILKGKQDSMLRAQKKYYDLLEDLREKRMERINFRAKKLSDGTTEEEKNNISEYVGLHEMLLEKQVDNEAVMLERLKHQESKDGDPNNVLLRFSKNTWRWYGKQPRHKRILYGAMFGAAIAGVAASGMGLPAALAAGGTVAARRGAGGFFGSTAAIWTKRFADTQVEKQEAKALGREHENFQEKNLLESSKKRQAIRNRSRWGKRAATGGAAGAAMLAGGSAAAATNDALYGMVEAKVDATVDVAKDYFVFEDSPETNETTMESSEGSPTDTLESEPQQVSGATKNEASREGLHEFRKNQTEQAVDRMHSQTKIAQELAKKMGIEDTDNLRFKTEGYVPTEINGQKVPLELLTEEQRTGIETARELKGLMNGTADNENMVPSTDAGIESNYSESVNTNESVNTKDNTVIESKQTDVSHMESQPEEVISDTPLSKNESIPEQKKTQPYNVRKFEEARANYEQKFENQVPHETEKTHANVEEFVPENKKVVANVEEHIPKQEKIVANPEASVPKTQSAPEKPPESTEIKDILERYMVKEPEALKMEGVYEAGSSVERELQQFLDSNNWIHENYPDLTEQEVGAIAHRIRLHLEDHPELEEEFKIHDGDWNKVLKNDTYSFYIDKDFIENEIEEYLNTEHTTAPVESNEPTTPEVNNESSVPQTETAQVDEVAVEQEVQKTPEFDDVQKKVAPPDDLPVYEEVNKPLESNKSIAEESLEDLRGVQESEKVPEQKLPETENTEWINPDTQKAYDMRNANISPPTFEEEIKEAGELLHEQGADYYGEQTRGFIETFFKDEFLEKRLRPHVLSSWGPISHARLQDILDGEGNIQYAIGDNPPITMGKSVEDLCKSVVMQLEKQIDYNAFESMRKENITLGDFVARVAEKIEQK